MVLFPFALQWVSTKDSTVRLIGTLLLLQVAAIIDTNLACLSKKQVDLTRKLALAIKHLPTTGIGLCRVVVDPWFERIHQQCPLSAYRGYFYGAFLMIFLCFVSIFFQMGVSRSFSCSAQWISKKEDFMYEGCLWFLL